MFSLNKDQKLESTSEQKIYYTLRIASAMCFIGHGAFGIITKPIWCNYFGVFGIGHYTSFRLMPVVGCFDILMGIIILLYPLRAVIMWLVVWGTITALLRLISGEPFADGIGTYTPPGHWNAIATEDFIKQNYSDVRWARNMALLNMTEMDAGIVCWNTKYYYFNPRPTQMIPGIKTLTGIPNFTS
jgi:hypothetical protein